MEAPSSSTTGPRTRSRAPAARRLAGGCGSGPDLIMLLARNPPIQRADSRDELRPLQGSPLKSERSPRREPIAVTGYGLTTCLGRGAEANWQALASGRSGLGPITRFPVEGYPVKDGGEAPPPGEDAARSFPPELRPLSHLVEACEEALGAAGIRPGFTGPRSGLVVGSSLAASDSSERFFRSYLESGAGGADYSALRSYYAEDQLSRLL